MAEAREKDGYKEELADYEEEDQNALDSAPAPAKPSGGSAEKLVFPFLTIFWCNVFFFAVLTSNFNLQCRKMQKIK